MENFEYSIRLNDRDWAEFYLASEECSLIQPALATADEPLLSDLEEGELEEIRWGTIPPQDTAGRLSHRAPDAHLLAEDLLSGSEDETELGSVSRFLFHDDPSDTVLSSRTQESQLSGVTLKHFGMATPTEGDSEMDIQIDSESLRRRNPITSPCSPDVSSLRPTELEGTKNPEKSFKDIQIDSESLRRRDPITYPSGDVSSLLPTELEGTKNPEKSKDIQIDSESLQRRDPITYPPGDVSSLFPTELEGTKNPVKSFKDIQIDSESLQRRDPITYPPGDVSSLFPTELEGTKNPVKSFKDIQIDSESLQRRDPITYPPGDVSSLLPTELEGTKNPEKSKDIQIDSESLRRRDPITYPSGDVSSLLPTELEGTKNPEKSKDIQIDSESLQRRDPITYPSGYVSSPLPIELEGTKNPEKSKDIQIDSESLQRRDPITYPSGYVSSPLPIELEGTKNPEKSFKDIQIVLMAQPTPFHENPFQGDSGTTNLLPENRIEGPQERESNEGAQNSKETDHHDILKERDRNSPCDDVAMFPKGPEGNKCITPTQETDSSCDERSARQREMASSATKAERDHSRESYYGLGMAESFEKESQLTIQGRSSDFREEFVPFFPTSQDSPETQERRGNTREGMGKEGPVSYPATELPGMSGPEMYEYFFDDSGEKDTAPKISLLSGHPSTPSGVTKDPNSEEVGGTIEISIPEVYEYFFDNSARGKRNWKGVLLSFPASEARKAARALKSLIGRHMRRARPQTTNHGELLRRGSQGTLVLLSPGILTEAQSRPKDLHMAVMEPERPLRPVVTHRDMCLGFVAFASWAVKTSDLQAPDAWKIVLLANFGTLSAIRYFRRQVITEGQHAT